MNNFQDYSKYYDLFYEKKDYRKEANFLLHLAKKYNSNVSQILDLGCGTGLHAIEFAKLGSEVSGMDLSEAMILRANNIKNQLDTKISCKLNYLVGDIRSFSLNRNFDVIFSLFHVVSYLKTNRDLLNALSCISNHLNKGGVFIFDYWYGPGVMWDKPIKRKREIKKDGLLITRNATPKIDFNNSKVEVNYHLKIKDSSGNMIEEVKELHEMRYLFLNELELAAKISGLKIIESGEWLTGKSLSENCWTAYSILKK